MILPSHFGVPALPQSVYRFEAPFRCAPKEYLCRDKNSPCRRQSPSDSRPLAVPCRHVLSHFVPNIRSERTISGSTRLRDVRALHIQRGVMFARNFIYPRTTEPELDANSLASLGIESTLLSSSEMPRRFPLSLSRPQTVKDTCQH